VPDWLTHLLGQLSPEGFVGGTIVALAAIVRTIASIMEARTTREFKRKASSIPPSECTMRDLTEIERENERLRGELHRLQWRVDELETQLNEVGRDHGHTARALTHEREECERLRVRVGELKEMLRSVNSGASTHLPTHPRTRGSSPSWEVIEEDVRPTPKLGMHRVRYEPPKTE
jgi:predicted nuclease with TOPRIM domain